MPSQISQPSTTYPAGSYGPFTVNNLDAADSVGYLRSSGNWLGAKATIVIEMRVGNGAWFSVVRDTFTLSGPYTNKYTGLLVSNPEWTFSIPRVGEAQRDLRMTITTDGTITTPLTLGTR